MKRLLIIGALVVLAAGQCLAQTTPTSVSIDTPAGGMFVMSGNTLQLTATCQYPVHGPDDCTFAGGVVFASGDHTKATITSGGLITPLVNPNAGGCGGNIVFLPAQATAGGTVGYRYFDILGTVLTPVSAALFLTPATAPTITPGDKMLMSMGWNLAAIYPCQTGMNGNANWSSSNSSIASVDRDGFVTAGTCGTYPCTATITGNVLGQTATEVVTVVNPTDPGAYSCGTGTSGGDDHTHCHWIRTDGGTRAQCNGTWNLAYPGSGTGQNCAFINPMWLWTDDSNDNTNQWVVSGGDTILINPGDYFLGAKGYDNAVYANYWHYLECHGNGNCTNPIWPTSTAARPLKIYGTGYQSCPAYGSRPRLIGRWIEQMGLNFKNAVNVDIQCIDLTNGGYCSSQSDLRGACGDYQTKGSVFYGIMVDGGTTNISLTNVGLSGFAADGIYSELGSVAQLTNVNVEGNAHGGLNLDLGDGFRQSAGFNATKLKIRYSGCTKEPYDYHQISSISRSGSTVTVTFTAPHNFGPTPGNGSTIVISGVTPSDFNGTFTVTSVTTGTNAVTISNSSNISFGNGMYRTTFTTSATPVWSLGSTVWISGASVSVFNNAFPVTAIGTNSFNVGTTSSSVTTTGNASQSITLTYTSAGTAGAGSGAQMLATHPEPFGLCTDQGTGGYGDGIGTANTLGSWACDQCETSYNTQDGPDLLHSNSQQFKFTRLLSQGNEGQPIKLGSAHNVTLENSILIGNCRNLVETNPGRPVDYDAWLGYGINTAYLCRAGQLMPMGLFPDSRWKIGFNTIVGILDTTFPLIYGVPDFPLPVGIVQWKNNVGIAYSNANYNLGSYPGAFYFDLYGDTTIFSGVRSNNVYYRYRNGIGCPTGFSNEVCTDPGFTAEPTSPSTDSSLDNFNAHPAGGSNLLGTGTPFDGVTVDFYGNARDAFNPNIGAVEGTTPPPPTTPSAPAPFFAAVRELIQQHYGRGSGR